MDIRLVKLASEYNVGLVHLAEFLNSKGFGLTKPSPGLIVNITDELREILDKHYSKDLAAKKEADMMKPMPMRDVQAAWLCASLGDAVLAGASRVASRVISASAMASVYSRRVQASSP